MSRYETPKPKSYIEGTEMTVEQIDEWMQAMPVKERQDLLGVMKRLADAGAHCGHMNHLGAIEHFQEEARKLREDITRMQNNLWKL